METKGTSGVNELKTLGVRAGKALAKIALAEGEDYNGVRLWRDRPEVAQAAISMLSEPREVLPYREIMRRLRMSYHLLRELERQHVETIDQNKKTLAQLCASVAEESLERLRVQIKDCKSASQLAVATGIMIDKYLNLSGENTQKVDVSVKFEDTREAFNELHHAVLEKFQEKQATVLELTE